MLVQRVEIMCLICFPYVHLCYSFLPLSPIAVLLVGLACIPDLHANELAHLTGVLCSAVELPSN
jgi:hypothetical protein